MSGLMYQSNVDPSNMQEANKWYNWALQIAINSGDYEALWRNADKYQKTNFRTSPQMTAYGYIKELEGQSSNKNEKRETITTMKKMLKMWESKIESETKQKEESEKAFELLKESYIVPQVQNNVAYTSTQQNASTTSITTAKQIAHNKAVALQAQTKIDNAAQSSAFWALRSGEVSAASQMASPYSKQTIQGKQNYVIESQANRDKARVAAEKRTEEIQKARLEAAERNAQMISVSENTKVMPSYDAQSQNYNNSVSNNNVNPAALYTPQPVNSNGNSQNSSVSGGVNVNANYNYATQMNDFSNQNPTGQVNMGQAPQPYGYTGGKSSIPIENEVNTSLLGGDIQHQESEINTNVGYLPEMNDPQDTIGFSQVGSAGIALAGIGALLLMGKIK